MGVRCAGPVANERRREKGLELRVDIASKGYDIALLGRIVAATDVFDALITSRPYKRAFSVEETMEYMTTPSGRHFEPRLINALVAILPEILKIQTLYADELGTVHEMEPGRT